MTKTCTRQNCLALPYAATTERKAEMFADAIEVLFYPGVETEVFEDGGKWGIAVVKGMEDIADPTNDERIVAAFTLLLYFDFIDGHGTVESLEDSLDEVPPLQKALTKRARRSFCLEDKLDRILARLDGVSAPSKGRGIEALIPSVGDTSPRIGGQP